MMQKRIFNMQNVLITGSKGQLGLKFKDLENNFPDIKIIFCDIDDLDITKYEDLGIFFQNVHIDIIINCAAYTAVDLAESDESKAYSVNADGPRNLAVLSKLYNAKLVHISTDYVYDGTKNTPYSESDGTNPLSVYGKSKLKGETEVLKENENAVIIRTSWLYSEYGNNFAKTIIKLGKEKDILKVVYDQTGTPTYAGDLALAVFEIINKYIKDNIWFPGIYNYSNLGVCSWYDFAVELLRLSGNNKYVIPVLSSEFPSVAKRPNYSVLDKSKIINTFNIKIPYWRDACENMMDNVK